MFQTGRAPKYQREDYAFRSDRFDEVTAAIDVGTPRVDAFATENNSRCPIFWSRDNDAFDRSWTAQGLLWVNPPFSQLEQVVRKITDEGAEYLLVCSNGPHASWQTRVQDLATKAHFFPPGSRLFETEKVKSGPVKWGVWVLYIPGRHTPPPHRLRGSKVRRGSIGSYVFQSKLLPKNMKLPHPVQPLSIQEPMCASYATE